MVLRLAVLGAPLIERDDRPVILDDPLAVALLSYLAVEGRPVARKDLVALGWPDADPVAGDAALATTLAAIRRAVGDVVAQHESHVALAPGVEVDVRRWRALSDSIAGHGHPAAAVCPRCAGPLHEIVDLHRGGFLEGHEVPGNMAYDVWHTETADRFRRGLATVLARLVDVHVLASEFDRALAVARRRLSLDPLDESAHRALMAVHAWQGRPDRALRQYRDCVRALQVELGVDPLPATTRLYEDVLAGNTPPLPVAGEPSGDEVGRSAAGVPRTTGRPPPVPLVAREAELAMLTDTIARMHRDGVVLVVEGEAGIGRTRLLHELGRRAGALGRRVIATTCRRDSTEVGFGAVTRLLRTALRQPAVRDAWLTEVHPDVAREVGRLHAELVAEVGTPPPATGPGALWRLVDAAATALAAAACAPSDERPPGVIVIDDVQWIDRSSLAVLDHLSRRLGGNPVCLVVSWRTDLVGRGHPLRRLVADLARRQLVRQLPLQRLDLEAVQALRAALAGSRPDAPPAEDVLDATEGIARLVVEQFTAPWHDRDDGGADPERCPVRRPLERAGPLARQVLEAAVVIGGPSSRATLRHVSGRTVEETAAAVDELVDRRLLSGDEPAYEVASSRVRADVLGAMTPLRLARLHGRVAAVLERGTRQHRPAPEVTVALAAHHAAAGDRSAAARWYQRAGDDAAAVLAVPEAIDHHQRALALGHDRPQRCHESLGDLHRLAGRDGVALAEYETAAAMTHDDHVAVLEHKIGRLHLDAGRCELAAEHLEAAMSALENLPPGDAVRVAAVVATDLGVTARCLGDHDRAAKLAAEALRAADKAGDRGAQARAHNLVGILCRDDLAAARAHLEQALDLARDMRDVDVEIAVADNLAQVHVAAGAPDRAVPLVEFGLARAVRIGDRQCEAVLRNRLADLLRSAGRNAEAMTHVKRAMALFAEIGEPPERMPLPWRLTAW